MSARPVITLLTDFGVGDPYVGAMRGRILQLCPEACVVDLTHEDPPQDRRGAAFVLGANWDVFPLGTKHLTVVDLGVGTARRPFAMRAAGHHFVGPDNGVLDAVIESAEEVICLDPRRVVGAAQARAMSARGRWSWRGARAT